MAPIKWDTRRLDFCSYGTLSTLIPSPILPILRLCPLFSIWTSIRTIAYQGVWEVLNVGGKC